MHNNNACQSSTASFNVEHRFGIFTMFKQDTQICNLYCDRSLKHDVAQF